MSLSLLNAWGQTSVEYTELRQPKIRFDRTTATNQTAQTVASGSHLVPVGIEVIELVIPEQVLLYMEILFALAANKSVVLTQQQLVDSSLESLGNGLYRITPINSLEAWQRVRQPTIQITGAQGYTAFTYTVTLHYSGNLTKSYTVSAQVVIVSTLSAQFALSAEAELLPAVTVSAIGVTLVALVSAHRIHTVEASLTMTAQSSTEAQNIKGTVIDFTSQFSQTGEAISSGLSWQQASTALTPIPVEISFSQLGAITVYYSQNNIVEVNTISVPLGVITELPASSFTGDITISIAADTAQLYGFKIIKQTGDIYSWGGLTEVTGNTTDYSNAGNTNKNLVLNRVPTRLAPSLRYVCLANIFNFDPSCMELWDTSNLTSMNNMFKGTLVQNSQLNQMSFIEEWRTGQVTNMDQMFKYCIRFNQNLSAWCVDQIPTAPSEFDFNTTFWTKTNRLPIWGTCPTASFNKGRYELEALGQQVLGAVSDISNVLTSEALGIIIKGGVNSALDRFNFSVSATALGIFPLNNINSVTVDTTQLKFGTGSALFNGTNALRTKPIQLPSANSTIEFWIRFTSLSGDINLFDAREQIGDLDSPAIFRRSNNNLVYWTGRTGDLISAASPMSTNNWYHIAVTNYNGFLRMWVNGTQHGSGVDHGTLLNPVVYSMTPISIGAYAGQNIVQNGITGNIDEFRISFFARYTANFTPPTQAFTMDNGTTLIVHMDGVEGSTIFTGE